MRRIQLMATGLFMVATISSALAQIHILDTSHYDTQQQMLLANEINESGEPYAEAIGYDLDQLDPMVPGFPDLTSYALGIENYEYSRYQLGTVVSRSGIGLHMAWSPVIMAMAAMTTDPNFDGSMTGGVANGFNEDDVLMHMMMRFGMLANQTPPMGAWPQFGEFISGDPHFAQPVDPNNFTMDFSTLRWDRDTMDKQLSPGALGQSLMKQYLWAQDMLGGFHDMDDEPVVPDGIVTPDSTNGMFDPHNNVFLGGNNLDGFIGQMLTAEGINKVRNLLDNLAYDGASLGSVDPMTYDPANGLRYFPHRIAVTEEMVPNMPPRPASYEVTDARSDLFDQVSLLWGTLNFKNMMDPNNTSDEAHIAYHSVFDGDPFPADMSTTGMPGPYDLMKGSSSLIFRNLMAMHFDEEAGSFAEFALPVGANFKASGTDEKFATDGSNGMVLHSQNVTTVGAAYSLVTLALFATEFAETPLADQANMALRAQADFMIEHMGNDRHLYQDRTRVRDTNHSTPGQRSVAAQSAAIRGLYAAYNATGDAMYLTAADEAYAALVEYYYRPNMGTFATNIFRRTARYTPANVALLSGALREARLVGGHTDATELYVEFWNNVVNKMQLAEGMPTGETGSDSDGDGIPFIPEQPDGVAPVFAPVANLWLGRGDDQTKNGSENTATMGGPAVVLHQNDPNPFNPRTQISFELGTAQHVGLKVYDVSGKLVRTLADHNLGSGPHTLTFDGERQASGLYYYVLKTDTGRQVRKMTLLK